MRYRLVSFLFALVGALMLGGVTTASAAPQPVTDPSASPQASSEIVVNADAWVSNSGFSTVPILVCQSGSCANVPVGFIVQEQYTPTRWEPDQVVIGNGYCALYRFNWYGNATHSGSAISSSWASQCGGFLNTHYGPYLGLNYYTVDVIMDYQH